MSETKMKVDAMAGFAAPPFDPILTDAGGGPCHSPKLRLPTCHYAATRS